jgi:hypothetical protein
MDNRFDLERRLQIALNEVERLEQENQRLRMTLARFQPEVGHVARGRCAHVFGLIIGGWQ